MKLILPPRADGVALLAYLLLVIMPVAYSVSLLSDYIQTRADIAQRMEQTQRIETGLKSRAPAGRALPEGPALFEAETATLAAADLQTQLTSLLGKHGATVLSAQAMASADGAAGKLQVSIDFMLPENELPDFLHSVESHRPFLFIEALSIRRRDETGNSGMLRLTLRAHGFGRGFGS